MEGASPALIVIACALLCAVLSIVTWHWRRRRLYEVASEFEGPPVLPIIGNTILFLGGYEAILKVIAELPKSYPSLFRIWLGHRLFIIATDPEQVKAIFMSPKTVEKGFVYRLIRPMAGTGLVTSPASIWRVHRKLIQPTFNAKIIDGFVDVFADQAQILANKLEQKLDGPEFEVLGLAALTSMDMLCETVMGLKIGAQTNGASDYVDALQKLAGMMCTRIFSPWLHPDFIYNRTRYAKNQQRGINIIHGFTDNVIEMKKSELNRRSQPEKTVTEGDECERTPRREAFLDYFLRLSREGDDKWSDEELRDEVSTLMVAGYDSTSFTNSFVLLMLASHPEIQEKVYQELYEIYGDADIDERPVTREDLGRMEYLERVIKETMRLFPLLPLLTREVTDDLKIGEHTIPKGSEACIVVFEVHRSEKYWLDPLKFNPDRFLPEEVAKRHPYTYLAFSAGPRNCIGIKYALIAMKTFHATILRRYILKKDKIVPVKDIRLKMEIALRPVEPIALRIETRIRSN